jgi:DNA-binding response OmpR family regulator
MSDSAKKILIIEDEFFIRDLYERYLTKNGYQVITAVDGEDGLNKAKSQAVDLILLDIMMPKKTGLEVLHELRNSENLAKTTPIYMLTNVGQENIIKDVFKIGADGYLLKSKMLPKQIVEEIQKILGA